MGLCLTNPFRLKIYFLDTTCTPYVLATPFNVLLRNDNVPVHCRLSSIVGPCDHVVDWVLLFIATDQHRESYHPEKDEDSYFEVYFFHSIIK